MAGGGGKDRIGRGCRKHNRPQLRNRESGSLKRRPGCFHRKIGRRLGRSRSASLLNSCQLSDYPRLDPQRSPHLAIRHHPFREVRARPNNPRPYHRSEMVCGPLQYRRDYSRMLKKSASRGGWPGESLVLAQRAVSEDPRWTRAVWDSSRPATGKIVMIARCGLAWDKARLGAPGLGG